MSLVFVLTAILGASIGFSLGLTGGGGAIFAVPMLVYAIGLPAREAVGISLLTVGSTALIGFVQRARKSLVEFPTGLLFATAGMIGAPIGSRTAQYVPERILLIAFATLMVLVAARMWSKANDKPSQLPILANDDAGPTCRRDGQGELRLTSQCSLLLIIVGLAAGILSGMFGVGGGFIIVPALVSFANMGMQRAIGTSLLIITLVSASGVASQWFADHELSLNTAATFTLGSVAGLFLGNWLSQRLAGPTLQRTFAAAILSVAVYVIVRSVVT